MFVRRVHLAEFKGNKTGIIDVGTHGNKSLGNTRLPCPVGRKFNIQFSAFNKNYGTIDIATVLNNYLIA